MNEFRCRCCNRLMAKFEECRVIEIKCPKCKTINLYRNNEIILIQIGQNYIKKKFPPRRLPDFETEISPN